MHESNAIRRYEAPRCECERPCPQAFRCDECAAYWDRMIQDGFWDADLDQLTDAGLREAIKV